MSEDEFIITDYNTIRSELTDDPDIDIFSTNTDVSYGPLKLLAEDNKKAFEDYINTLDPSYKNCFYLDTSHYIEVLYDDWIVIRKISDPDPIYYFHCIMFPVQVDSEDSTHFSAIFSIPENGFDPNTKHIKKESVKDIKIMKDYIKFFSNDVNKDVTKPFNYNGTCLSGCGSYFGDPSTQKPVVHYDSKYIEWFPEKERFVECFSYKQPFILTAAELELGSKSKSNLPLILGISLGIGIPLLALFIYLFIKDPFHVFNTN